MPKITSSKDLLMLLIYAAGPLGQLCEPIQGQTRLMKMVFLFKKELSRKFSLDQVIDEKAFPDFEAYDYGPYSATVYSDLEFLVNLGFVEVVQEGEPEVTEEERQEFDYWTATGNVDESLNSQSLGRLFRLTLLGRKFVEAKLVGDGSNRISAAQLHVLAEFKKRTCEASLRSLLRYVYTRYGEMTVKSKIRDEVLG